MCQTAVISNQIVRLGTRSFKQRIEAVSGNRFPVTRLSRLNKCFDEFYEFLYSQLNSVTYEDYEIFGPQLSVLLATLKDLYKTCVGLPKSWGLVKETECLGRNYSALREIESDLKEFKAIKEPPPELLSLLAEAGERMNRLAVSHSLFVRHYK